MYYKRQQGVALVVGLTVLLVMTLLGVQSMRGAYIQEKMGGNARDKNISFQAAESALRAGEKVVKATVAVSKFGSTPGYYHPLANGTQLYQGASWVWDNDALRHTSSGLSNVSANPQYYIELMKDNSAAGKGKLYRVTARGLGASDQSITILQTMYEGP